MSTFFELVTVQGVVVGLVVGLILGALIHERLSSRK